VCAGGTEAPQALRHGGNLVRVRFDTCSFSPWDGRSPVSHPTCDIPFSKENLQIPERDDPSPPVVPGVQEIGLGSNTKSRLIEHKKSTFSTAWVAQKVELHIHVCIRMYVSCINTHTHTHTHTPQSRRRHVPRGAPSRRCGG
jgi:hypothetical protein